MRRIFQDRADAGRQLAERLMHYADKKGVLVVALPRGGVPVAAEIARALKAPLDVMIVRKLGAPQQPELAIGAIASGNVRVLNEDVVRTLNIPDAIIDAIANTEQQELVRREAAYRGSRPPLEVNGRTVIVVDDGIATGATMHAALKAIRKLRPARLVVAVPVAARSACDELQSIADEVVCVSHEMPFAIGNAYRTFPQLADDDVQALLNSVPAATASTLPNGAIRHTKASNLLGS